MLNATCTDSKPIFLVASILLLEFFSAVRQLDSRVPSDQAKNLFADMFGALRWSECAVVSHSSG